MNKQVTLVLALLVTALVGYIAFFERGSLSSKELTERKGKVLTTFVRDKVARLAITTTGTKLVLERSKDADDSWSSWRLVSPRELGADQDSVDKLLGELEWLSARRLLENVSAKDLETFGLTKPTYSVVYRVSGDDHTLRLGATDVHGQSFYAQVDGEQTVFVVPKTLVEALDHDLGHYRDKALLGDIVSAWARRLELSGPLGAVELEKDNGRWWVQAVPRSYADGKRVTALIDKLASLRAVRFLEGAERSAAQTALSAGSTTDLRIVPDEHREDKQAQRFVLRFAGECPGHAGERYAQAGDKGDPACVSADDLSVFDGKPDELRLSGLFDADPSEIEKLELVSGTDKLLLKRAGEAWQREGSAAPDREAVEAWLVDLRGQRASAFLPARELPAQTTLSLSLVTEAKPVMRVYLDQAAQAVLVRRDEEPVLLSFPLALGDRLALFEGRFGSMTPWEAVQPSQVQSVQIRHGALQRSLRLQAGAWQVVKGAGADQGRVRELVRELTKLHLLAIVTNRARPEHGLDKPVAELELGLSQGDPLELALGQSTARGRYARLGKLVVEVGDEVERGLLELAGGTPAKVGGGERGRA